MIIKTFLTLVVALSYVMCSYAENWEKVGDRSSKFQGIARYFGEQPGVKQKDVIEAFQNYEENRKAERHYLKPPFNSEDWAD